MELLYERYSAELLAYATSIAGNRDAAHDAVQEVFLRYFVERRYGRMVAQPRAWLYRVLRNYLFDRMDSAAVRREVGPENAVELRDPRCGPEEAAGQSEVARQILSVLSPRELECLCLRADGLSYDEAAEVLGVRPGTVSSLLTRVHKKLHDTVHDVQPGTLEALVARASACAHSS